MHNNFKNIACFLAIFLFSNGLAAKGWPVKPYVRIESFSYSDTVSIHDTLNDWKGSDFSKGERQWSWNWAEVGVYYKQFGIGLISRADYDFRFTGETAELFWNVSNKQRLSPSQHYDAQLTVSAFRATGVRFSYWHQDSLAGHPWSVELGLAYLRANYLIEGSLTGTADVINNNDFNYDANADYRYTKDPLFGRPYTGTTGQGFALDAATHISLPGGGVLSVQVRDLFSRLYWKSRAFSTAHSTSDRKSFDENGYVSIAPAFTGFEGTDERATQKLSSRWFSQYSHPVVGSWRANFLYRYQYGQSLVGIGAKRQTGHHYLGGSFWPQGHLVSLSDEVGGWVWSLSADQAVPRKVKVLWLSLRWEYL